MDRELYKDIEYNSHVVHIAACRCYSCSAFWLEDRGSTDVPITRARVDQLILRCQYFELKQEIF